MIPVNLVEGDWERSPGRPDSDRERSCDGEKGCDDRPRDRRPGDAEIPGDRFCCCMCHNC